MHFIEKEDFEAHEARVCIADGYVLADDRRPRLYSPEQYFKTSDEMIELFSDILVLLKIPIKSLNAVMSL